MKELRSGRHQPATLSAFLIALSLTACATRTESNGSMQMTGPAGRLHVDDGGSGGVPVVFVHSFAGSGQQWRAQLDHLRPERRAVAIDLRGHGQSEAPAAGGYSVDALADDIGAVVDELKLDRFVLVGHSMGGAAATAYVGKHPDRVAGLVLVGTPGKSPPEMAEKVLSSMKADYDKVNEEYWKSLLTGAKPEVESRIRADMKRVPKDIALSIIAAIFAHDPLPALRAYRGPTLIIDTTHSDGPQALHNQLPAISRNVITGTSHWPHMDKPEEFNRILDGFLASR